MKKIVISSSLALAVLVAASTASAQYVVFHQPAVVVQQPAVVVQQPVQPVAVVRPFVRTPGLGIGLRANMAWAGENELVLWGGGGVLRVIGSPRFGLELKVDANGCSDGLSVPIDFSGLVFFNRRGRVQPYILGGFNFNVIHPRENEFTFLYAGGHAGLGVEVLMGRHLGLTFEGRSFVQGLADPDVEGGLEYGVTFNTGLNFYFRRHNR